MPNLTISLPSAHIADIADAVAATYGVAATQAGLKAHILQHLRQTVREFERQGGAQTASDALVFDNTWDDLEN